MTIVLDCRTCGACCVGDLDDDYGFADCSADDVKRMSRHTRGRLVNVNLRGPGDPRAMTPTIVTEEFGKSCAFLRGTPTKRVSCGIYCSRPDVCRSFPVGGRGCLRSRAELGL